MTYEQEAHDIILVSDQIPRALEKVFEGKKAMTCYVGLCIALLSLGASVGLKPDDQEKLFKRYLDMSTKALEGFKI